MVVFKFKPIKWRTRDVSARIDREAMKIVREGAREFVREVVLSTPVLTGEARGSLLPIRRALKVRVPMVRGQPREGRNRSTGQQQKALWNFVKTQQTITFEFSIQLFHHWWNDLFPHHYPNGQRPTPWGGVAKGSEVFEKYIDDNVKRLRWIFRDLIDG